MKSLPKWLLAFACLYLLQSPMAFCANKLQGFYKNFDGMQAIDQHNQQFDFNKLQPKIALVNFIYTHCNRVCNTQTRALTKVFHSLPKVVKQDVAFVSISLDPIKDGPKTLSNYADHFNANISGWHFLSLNFFDIKALSTNLILFKPDYGNTLYDALENTLEDKGSIEYNLKAHATHLWLIDTAGRVRQKYVGNPVDVTRLSKELRVLHHLEFDSKK